MSAAVKQRGHRVRLGQTSSKPEGSPLDKAKAHEVLWQHVSPLFDAARFVQGVSFVYFIGEADNGALKIGVAKHPVKRLREMQTGNPRRLRVERILIGDSDTEKLLHEMWEPYVVEVPTRKVDAKPGTEWFRPEIREHLFPIVDTAAEKQAEYLTGGHGELSFDLTETFVRSAHAKHDHVVELPHQVRRLGSVVGYASSRRSRL